MGCCYIVKILHVSVQSVSLCIYDLVNSLPPSLDQSNKVVSSLDLIKNLTNLWHMMLA